MKALVQLSETLSSIDRSTLLEYMPVVNQRVLEFLRSPRSHVCRTGCQVAGRLFAEVKDTRRPVCTRKHLCGYIITLTMILDRNLTQLLSYC